MAVMNRRRISALLLCAALVLVLAVSVAFLAGEADHDCCGDEHCPVCRMIAVNVRVLKALMLAVFALLLSRLLLSGQSARRRQETGRGYRCGTLVSWKIRLDD